MLKVRCATNLSRAAGPAGCFRSPSLSLFCFSLLTQFDGNIKLGASKSKAYKELWWYDRFVYSPQMYGAPTNTLNGRLHATA